MARIETFEKRYNARKRIAEKHGLPRDSHLFGKLETTSAPTLHTSMFANGSEHAGNELAKVLRGPHLPGKYQ